MCCSNKELRILSIVGLGLALGACQPEAPATAGEATSEIPQACTARVANIQAVPEDSFPPAERCRLVNLAVASVAEAGADTGLEPADTAAIRSALLVPLSQTTPEGALIRATWHVTLSLEGRPYDAEVIVDRGNGGVAAARIHKPM
jgi:hypothetical protein